MKKELIVEKINIAILLLIDNNIQEYTHKHISEVTGFNIQKIKRYMKYVRECDDFYNFDLLTTIKLDIKLNRLLDQDNDIVKMYDRIKPIKDEYMKKYTIVKWAGYKGLKSSYENNDF